MSEVLPLELNRKGSEKLSIRVALVVGGDGQRARWNAGTTLHATVSSFVLVRPEGEVVARSSTPQALARYAFQRGAVSVRHDYDLALAEALERGTP